MNPQTIAGQNVESGPQIMDRVPDDKGPFWRDGFVFFDADELPTGFGIYLRDESDITAMNKFSDSRFYIGDVKVGPLYF
ncbi:MAG: hypothetical protein ACTHNN_13060 [Xanthobacteraceae bacterium]